MSAQHSDGAAGCGEPDAVREKVAADSAAPTMVVALGPMRLTGRSAQATLVALLVTIGALVFYYRARILATPLTISAVLWLAFTLYWGAAARNSAPTVSSETAGSRAVHTNLMWLSLFLLFAPLPWLDWRVLPAGAVWALIGLTLHVGSLFLAIAARRTLGRYWSGEITHKVDHELIRSGPYRFVRHPIYTAMLGMATGTALVSGDTHAILGAAVMAGAYTRKIRLEERNLDEVFGPRYEEYRRSTRALIPWVF